MTVATLRFVTAAVRSSELADAVGVTVIFRMDWTTQESVIPADVAACADPAAKAQAQPSRPGPYVELSFSELREGRRERLDGHLASDSI